MRSEPDSSQSRYSKDMRHGDFGFKNVLERVYSRSWCFGGRIHGLVIDAYASPQPAHARDGITATIDVFET